MILPPSAGCQAYRRHNWNSIKQIIYYFCKKNTATIQCSAKKAGHVGVDKGRMGHRSKGSVMGRVGGSNAHSLSDNLCVLAHDWSPLSIRAFNLRVLSNHLHSLSMGERRIIVTLLSSTHSQKPCQATESTLLSSGGRKRVARTCPEAFRQILRGA